MTLCLVAESPFLKANAGTVRFQVRFAVFLDVLRVSGKAKMETRHGMSPTPWLSSAQPTVGAVGINSIWEMSAKGKNDHDR
jgi:hypothetical protein